jgi:hypothetical protein
MGLLPIPNEYEWPPYKIMEVGVTTGSGIGVATRPDPVRMELPLDFE